MTTFSLREKVSYDLAEAIRENRLSGDLCDFGRRSFYTSLSYLLSGLSQWNGEYAKITGIDQGEDPNKFPEGLDSLNFGEEMLEGGVPAAIGSIAMLYIYKFFRNREGKAMTTKDEAMAVFAGFVCGNVLLTALGGLVHELVGMPDVPTMEMLHKILGG